MWRFLIFISCCWCCSALFGQNEDLPWYKAKEFHHARSLLNSGLEIIAKIGDENHFRTVLEPFNRVRVVGTEGHAAVRKHIADTLEGLTWTVEQNAFEDQTPLGPKIFTNIIATYNPAATRRLVLACHYDSKLTPKGFIGAVDSAVPCAMLLNLAHVMQNLLIPLKKNYDLTLQFIFFDGEEAFVEWNDFDSLYGSKQLANTMLRTAFPPGISIPTTEIHRIDMLVLLDLIGTADTSFVSLYQNTQKWYDRFLNLERKLSKANLIPSLKNNLFKKSRYYQAGIQDDHVPFLEKGVPILHLISAPFPSVWHKMSDNFNSLDYPTIEAFNTILRNFVTEYFSLL